ncbi:hypothetical protein [Rhodopila sp.]|uniref:hypothetical protein n=1 Tax=Rhodopila sp. TaxID=2480087 RepID=UPI003D13E740
MIWVLLAGFYLLFAGQISMTEIIAGVPATTAAAAVAVLLHRARSRRLRFRAPWLHVVGRPLAALLPNAVQVAGVLLHALWRRPDGPVGVVARQPFRQGEGHADDAGRRGQADDAGWRGQADDAGRRGLVTLGISLAPNGYVLSIPKGQDVLVMHRLVSAPPSPDRQWPA